MGTSVWEEAGITRENTVSERATTIPFQTVRQLHIPDQPSILESGKLMFVADNNEAINLSYHIFKPDLFYCSSIEANIR